MYVCVCVCVCMCVCVCNLYTYNARTKRTIHFIARNDRREQVKENTRIDRFLSFRDRKQEKWKKWKNYSRELRTSYAIVFPQVTSETRLTACVFLDQFQNRKNNHHGDEYFQWRSCFFFLFFFFEAKKSRDIQQGNVDERERGSKETKDKG